MVAAPHIIWLFQTDFLPLAYVEHRASAVRGWFDHVLHPAVFAGSQIFFLLPSFFIASALFWPRQKTTAIPAREYSADAFDRRIVTLLAFGPGLTMILLTAVSGRGTFAMWGYPLWLYVGLWLVLNAPALIDRGRLVRIVAAWGAVFAIFAVIFAVNYTVLPLIDHRYRAVFFPGDKLGAELTAALPRSDRKQTRLCRRIDVGWRQSRALFAGPAAGPDRRPAARAPWIDLDDLHKKGAIVVWTESDTAQLPAEFAAVAGNAEVEPPFDLPMRRGSGEIHVGWAILKPQAR